MRRIPQVIVSLLFIPFISHAEVIHYVGSSTVGKFITDAAKVYKKSTFTINTRPESSGGEKAAATGKADIGGVARELNQKYIDKGAMPTLIGKDAISIIVNMENPISDISSAELKAIFTGKIKNWSKLGGPDLPIIPLIVKRGSATRKVFAAKILEGADYKGTNVVTPDAKIVTRVSREKGAIGQISFAFIVNARNVRPLAVNGQKATVYNPEYPITRQLYLATKGEAKGKVKAFIDWALSPEGQEIVKKRFIGIKTATLLH